MFFHLQYYDLISRILKNAQIPGDKFYGIRIITQGYDYVISSFKKGWGLNPLLWYRPFVRIFLGHGSWLKTPMLMRGVKDHKDQKDIIFAMIYLFNEMMIEIGRIVNVGGDYVHHIDHGDQ